MIYRKIYIYSIIKIYTILAKRHRKNIKHKEGPSDTSQSA